MTRRELMISYHAPQAVRSAIVAFLLLMLALVGSSSVAVASIGEFIGVPDAVDMVHDAARNILYVTRAGEVLRYDLAASRFLSSYYLGGALQGMDMSLDGNSLAVADTSYSGSQSWIHIVNLQSGTSQKILFSHQGGSFDVAFGNDGNILITTSNPANVSGLGALLFYGASNGQVSALRFIGDRSLLGRSADGSVIAYAECTSSLSFFGLYRTADGTLLGPIVLASTVNADVAVNRTGDFTAIPVGNRVEIYDSQAKYVGSLFHAGNLAPINVAYSPTHDILYVAWSGMPYLEAYDAVSLNLVTTYDFGLAHREDSVVLLTGRRIWVSPTGSVVFAIVDYGIRYAFVPNGRGSSVYLPFVQSLCEPSSRGIYGRVTYNGLAADHRQVYLRVYNGFAWSNSAATWTDQNGEYSFPKAPSIFDTQKYYVLCQPESTSELSFWQTRVITSYRAGCGVRMATFDTANIALLAPSPGAVVSLPTKFEWIARYATPTDSYEYNLFNPSPHSSGPEWWIWPLGFIGNYTLTSLASGFATGTPYGWYVSVDSPDGGYGVSHYYRIVAFANTGASVNGPMKSANRTIDSREPILPRLER